MRGKFEVLLTTYDFLMGSDMQLLSKICWHHLIIDEGHRLKNSACKLNTVLKGFKTKHRLLLTGVTLSLLLCFLVSVKVDPN